MYYWRDWCTYRHQIRQYIYWRIWCMSVHQIRQYNTRVPTDLRQMTSYSFMVYCLNHQVLSVFTIHPAGFFNRKQRNLSFHGQHAMPRNQRSFAIDVTITLLWCHNGLDGVSNRRPHDCLLSRLFGRRSKKTSKLRVTCLCAGISPGTGEFPAQRASNVENVSISWRHHATTQDLSCRGQQAMPRNPCSFPIDCNNYK